LFAIPYCLSFHIVCHSEAKRRNLLFSHCATVYAIRRNALKCLGPLPLQKERPEAHGLSQASRNVFLAEGNGERLYGGDTLSMMFLCNRNAKCRLHEFTGFTLLFPAEGED